MRPCHIDQVRASPKKRAKTGQIILSEAKNSDFIDFFALPPLQSPDFSDIL